MVSFSSDHLRSRIAWRSTCRLEGLALVVHIREAEVHDFDVILVIQKEVFRLQISMANSYTMDVFYTGNDLLSEAAGFILL